MSGGRIGVPACGIAHDQEIRCDAWPEIPGSTVTRRVSPRSRPHRDPLRVGGGRARAARRVRDAAAARSARASGVRSECTSLIERNLSDNKPPRVAVLGSDTLDLDNPSSFYSLLEKLRGPSTFDLHDPKREADTARQPLDNCSTRPKVLSSLFGATTTTTTTSTTVPGS